MSGRKRRRKKKREEFCVRSPYTKESGEKIRIILQEEKVLVPEGGEENISNDLCA